jgi:hypothetical protein
MIGTMLVAMALQAAAPSTEAELLGRRLADTGTLAALVPLITAKETEELVADHKELSDDEKAELRATAKAVAARETGRLLDAEGHAYAVALSVMDLRALVAAAETSAAVRQRAAMPGVIAATMTSIGKLDFKGDVLKLFCANTGKACVPIE